MTQSFLGKFARTGAIPPSGTSTIHQQQQSSDIIIDSKGIIHFKALQPDPIPDWHTHTKEEWRAVVVNLPQKRLGQPGTFYWLPWHENRGASFTDDFTFSKTTLLSAVGNPNRYQTFGLEKVLYWDCSDGTIQFCCWAEAYDSYDVVRGQINDF